ncbi:MAG: monovalent cation/H+ antiporter subunit D family protein [Desulfobulbaceae bacterium]|jgi:multicomponent Na+:H+ antiporter subunit D|nr:monovalent cation/H+ antiporter subunit D family protein [Desulfobulbaceae bacterium]
MDQIPFISATPALAILVSLAAVPLIVLSSKRPNLREFWTFAAGGIKLLLILSMAGWILAGNTHTYELWKILPGLSLKLKVDGFGMLFALVASALWIVTSVYSIGYMRDQKEHAQTRYFCFFAIALSATIGVAFAGNLLTLYLFYEMLSLSTYSLVTHHQDEEARGGGRKYLTYLLGTSIGLALPAMLITYNITGSLEFSSLGVFPEGVSKGMLILLLLMFVFGFSKAGLMPFHSWLPGAMVAPTPVSALLHAVAVVKVGVFSVLRIFTGIFGIDLLAAQDLNTIICIIASFTVIVSSCIALTQDNLKRRLAFSTIGQLAYIILGAGLASKLGVTGSMLHISMHAFGKITLFFCAGAIFVATGKKYISEMVGIGRRMPITMFAFFIGSLSIIGLPPTGGMISKLLMVRGAMEADMAWVLAVYLVSSFLNAAYFLPIVYKAFFCTEEESLFPQEYNEAPVCCWLPPVITATVSMILFFFPGLFLGFAQVMMSG